MKLCTNSGDCAVPQTQQWVAISDPSNYFRSQYPILLTLRIYRQDQGDSSVYADHTDDIQPLLSVSDRN